MQTRKDHHKTGTLRGAIFAGLLLCGAVLLALAGCTKEPAEGPGGPKGGVVTVSFATPAIGETAAAAQTQNAARQTPRNALSRTSGASAAALPATRAALAGNTTVRVVAFTAATGNPVQANYVAEQTYYVSGGNLLPCMVNDDGSFATAAPTAKMELMPGSYDFYAVTPALPLNTDKATVSVANGVDYAASATKGVTVDAPKTYTLTELDRKCAKVTFVVKKADDYSEMSALGVTASGTGLTLKYLPAAQSATLNADIPAAAGATTFTVPASAFTNTDATTAKAATVLLPRATDDINLSYDLSYTISGNSTRGPAIGGTTFDLALEKGRSYTLTLTMLKSGGGASLSVKEWTNNGWNADMGEPPTYPYVMEGKYIVSWDMAGYSGEPLHDNWTTTPAHAEGSSDANESGMNTVSARFEVAAEDCNSTNAPGVTQSDRKYTWTDAQLACAAYSQSGTSAGQWRLPTLKELQLICSKNSELTGSLTSYSSYWATTEYIADYYIYGAWNVYTNTGSAYSDAKSTSYYVRCVRDI